MRVHVNTATECIVDGESALHRMVFKDGEYLETDVILFSAGIRPEDRLARNAGLNVGERGGIVIDDSCRTSHADVWAIGKCALWSGKIFGPLAPGYEMATP